MIQRRPGGPGPEPVERHEAQSQMGAAIVGIEPGDPAEDGGGGIGSPVGRRSQPAATTAMRR
jgi:hypothetical protein